METKIKKKVTLVCQHCKGEFEVFEDDILTEYDSTCAFENIYKLSIQCPLCMKRNILETKNIDGKVTKYGLRKKVQRNP